MTIKEKKELPLQFIKGIGPQRAMALSKEGIVTPKDVLENFPRKYIDRNAVASLSELEQHITRQNLNFSDVKLSDIKISQEYTIIAKIIAAKEQNISKSRKFLKLILSDKSYSRAAVIFWNRVDYFKKAYQPGDTIVVSGKPELDRFSNSVVFTHPEIEKIDEEDSQLYASGGILPKYKMSENLLSARINMKIMRKLVAAVIDREIDSFEESLPDRVLQKYHLPEIKSTVKNLHFPESTEVLDKSKFRIKFEELFYFQLFIALRRYGLKTNEKAPVFSEKSQSARLLYDSLPFKLTDDQKKVICEIDTDFSSGKPMNRLLQGDVGSGKTIVSMLAALMAVDNGYQVAYMAPTELLAEQQYRSFINYFTPLGVKVTQVVGGQKARLRREIFEDISNGNVKIIVGTHALFQSEVHYNKLGFVIIDEQHRFGVMQRSRLKELGRASYSNSGTEFTDYVPHILVMSATPIPRTLSMTIYGDLDVSIIRQMPAGRLPVLTKVVFESSLPDVYDFIRSEIGKGRQAFIVYPLVEKSEKLDLKSAIEHFDMIKEDIFPEFRCGLLHGQMFWYEKEETMNSFLNKEFDLLIATTVIEVGIDIANATIMLIENAERFGLSQLHQLRGRVGRGADQSYCFLATKDNFRYNFRNKSNPDEERISAVVRLKAMEDTTDGFKISEIDMQLRGPGDLIGTRQAGLPEFKYTDLVSDGDIITKAKHEAESVIEQDPHLRSTGNQIIRKTLQAKYFTYKNYIDIA